MIVYLLTHLISCLTFAAKFCFVFDVRIIGQRVAGHNPFGSQMMSEPTGVIGLSFGTTDQLYFLKVCSSKLTLLLAFCLQRIAPIPTPS